MLKIGKYEIINDELIESFCIYGSRSTMELSKKASEKNMIRKIMGRYGFKSFTVMEDGYIFLCPFLPDTYMKKLNESDFLVVDQKRYFIRKNLIREITTKPNAGQHQEIKEAKQDMRYVNLSRKKVTRYYIFTITGRIYGVHSIEKKELEAIC